MTCFPLRSQSILFNLLLEVERMLAMREASFLLSKKVDKGKTCDTLKKPIFVGPGEAVRQAPCTKRGDDMTVTEILQLLSLLVPVVLVVITAIKK